MGCPPSAEEKSEWQDNTRIAEADSKLRSLEREMNDFKNLLNKMISLHEISSELKTLGTALLSNTAGLSFKTKEKPDVRGNDNTSYYAYLSGLNNVAEDGEVKVKAAEVFLCDNRCKLFNALKDFPGIIEKLATDMEPVAQAYMDHRNEDRQQWIKWLERQVFGCESDIQYGLNDGVKEKAKKLLQKIKIEIARVNELTDAEVWGDSTSFGRNEKEFDHMNNYR